MKDNPKNLAFQTVKLGGLAAKGRNDYFNAETLEITPSWYVYPAHGDAGELEDRPEGVRVEVLSGRPGKNAPIIFHATNEGAKKIAEALFASIGQSLLFWYDEKGLAYQYDYQKCGRCMSEPFLACKTDHTEGQAYWALPEEVRERMRKALADAIWHNNHLQEILSATAEDAVIQMIEEGEDKPAPAEPATKENDDAE